MSEVKTAIIIGAGPAGLTAAYKLLKETDIKPIIYEETDRIGGISCTIPFRGNRIDIGGHRFFSKSEEINSLWETIMPTQGRPGKDDLLLNREKPYAEAGPDPESDDNVMLIRNRVSRIFFRKRFFDYPISLSIGTIRNMGFANTVKAGFGYLASCIHKLPEDNLENFYINRFGKPLYKMFFEDYTTKLWGISPKELSADWGAQRVKGLSLRKAITDAITRPFRSKGAETETSLIEQYRYPKYGPGQFWETMAQQVEELGGVIQNNRKVESINVSGSRIESLTLSNGEKVRGDYYFSSMAIKDLIAGMGAAPADVAEIASGLPYRDFMTVGILVNKMEIQNKTRMKTVGDIVPDCWIYIQEKEVKVGRLQIFNNWSPYMVENWQNTVWIGMEYFCSEGDEIWNMSDEDFTSLAIDELEKIGVIKKESVLDTTRIRIKKAYPAYFGTYSRFEIVQKYLDSIENLYCIGRNGQHRYNNMDHSMATAIEAVNCIKSSDSKKAGIWSVNTEKTYHEEIKKRG